MTQKKQMVTAAFRNKLDAEGAYESLREMGYADDEINVLMSEKTRTHWYEGADKSAKHQVGSEAIEGVGVGGAVGTVVGAALGAVVAIGTTIALPGLGLIVAGPIIAALAGGGAGALTGGLVGGLVGLGLSKENAEAYQELLRKGGAAVGVKPHESAHVSKIEKLFKDYNGENIIYS